MRTVVVVLALFALPSLAAEYPFPKEHKLETKLHRYVPGMHFVDLDGDKDIDIVANTEGHHGVVTWWENKKKGLKWQEHEIPTGLPIPVEPWSIAVGDIDGDKDLDLVVLTRYKGVHILENKGKAKSWKARRVLEEKPGSADRVRLADIDGDKDLDIVMGGSGLVWLENLGKAKTWEDPQEIYGKDRKVNDFAIVDVDKDDDVDIVFTGDSYGREGLYILVNDDGPWNARNLLGQKPKRIEILDYDDDKDPDILAVMESSVSVWLNHEHSGDFGEEPLAYLQEPVGNATVFDISGDGLPDLVFGPSSGDDGLWWFENPGDEGEWEKTRIAARTQNAAILRSVDFDKDKDQDLFIGFQGLGEWRHQEIWYENKSRKSKKKKKK